MTGACRYDAVIIGAGVNGLAAASYLAMARKRVLVVEGGAAPGGLCATQTMGGGVSFSKAAHALHALDPHVVKDLKLARHGLEFAARDMVLVGLRRDGNHIVLGRDDRASARHIAAHSEADARAWPRFRREWSGLARDLRSLWWRLGPKSAEVLLEDARVQRLSRMGTQAWLDSWFESDALKTTLGFDAHALSPFAAGSALLPFWRAAQEMCGLQGAVAIPKGGMGAVAEAFANSVRDTGAEIRTGERVVDVVTRSGKVAGVALASGKMIAAPLVLSSLSRIRTLSFASVRAALGLEAASGLDRQKSGIAMARVTLVLDVRPSVSGTAIPASARLVLSGQLEALATAHAQACAGRLPQELTMEAILAEAPDPALSQRYVVSVLVGPVPSQIEGGWSGLRETLAAKVVAALAPYLTDLNRHLVAIDVLTPENVRHAYGADDAFGGTVDAIRLLADWRARVRTPLRGLIMCGAGADPIGAVSGRGGRAAARFALEQEKDRDD